MKGLNIIAVFNKNFTHVLMCFRRKEPYKGMYNFVGGKIKAGKTSICAAYRELEEETGITANDINLSHFMDFSYYHYGLKLELFVGKLDKDMSVYGEENELFWIPLTENFFDMSRFAGEGNIGHMITVIEMEKDKIFA